MTLGSLVFFNYFKSWFVCAVCFRLFRFSFVSALLFFFVRFNFPSSLSRRWEYEEGERKRRKKYENLKLAPYTIDL